jgi:DNA (cytosine-5)-methyltransferase 1
VPIAYYNENDPFAAQWLKNLIFAGVLPPGVVDERSILDVQAADLRGFDQCHFFAGIGGWALALELAGVPRDAPGWTGSCPCQPFSLAGKKKGMKDERHLWPVFHRLIAECEPAVVFGEQVASPDGREWLARVRADLEESRYAVGAADLCAAGVMAPHLRQRLYWVAEPDGDGLKGLEACDGEDRRLEVEGRHDADGRSMVRRGRAEDRWLGLAHCFGAGRDSGGAAAPEAGDARPGHSAGGERDAADASGAAGGPWSGYVWIPCADGKARRLKSGLEPLVNGSSREFRSVRARMVKGYGNAIVPELAAEFVRTWRDTLTLR